MTQPIRIAVIGCGNISNIHFENLPRFASVQESQIFLIDSLIDPTVEPIFSSSIVRDQADHLDAPAPRKRWRSCWQP